MEKDTKFHWQEGMKYALEGLKATFLLNGAATLSILTFIGNTKVNSTCLIWAMMIFAVRTGLAVLNFLLAYLTQQKYGNGIVEKNGWSDAQELNKYAIWVHLIALLLFFCGLSFAAYGFAYINVCPKLP